MLQFFKRFRAQYIESHVYHTNQLVRTSENMNKMGSTQISVSTEKPSAIDDSNTSLLMAQSLGVAEFKKPDSHSEEPPPPSSSAHKCNHNHMAERQKVEKTHDSEGDISDVMRLAKIQGIQTSQPGRKQNTTYSYPDKTQSNVTKKQHNTLPFALKPSSNLGSNCTKTSSQTNQRKLSSFVSRSDQIIKGIGRDFQLRSSVGKHVKSVSTKRQQIDIFVPCLAKNTPAIHIVRHVEKEIGLKV